MSSCIPVVTAGEDEAMQAKLLSAIKEAITRQLYEKICIGLFEKDKIVYAFMIATNIQRRMKLIDPDLWNLLLRGAGIFDKSNMPKKPESLNFVSDASWELVYCIG